MGLGKCKPEGYHCRLCSEGGFSTKIQRYPCRLLKMESMAILDNDVSLFLLAFGCCFVWDADDFWYATGFVSVS